MVAKTANVNTKIYDRSVDRAAMIRLYEKRVGTKVTVIINGHAINVADLISQHKDLASTSLWDKIDQAIVNTYSNAHNVTEKSLVDLVGDQLSYTSQNMEAAIGKIWRVEKPRYRIAEDIVLNKPLWKDKTLLQGWAGISSSERIRLSAVIRKGIADGVSSEDMALEVRRGNIFNISRFQAEGLVRTAITSVQAQTDQEIYKANEKALTGWQYVAVLDSRTTPLCAFRDGHIYPVNDTEHLPPAHFNCRSTTVPIVKSYDDLAKLENIGQIRKRNFEDLSIKQIQMYDGQTPLKETYNEWLIRQPMDVQLRHLGSHDRLELFRSGVLTIDKFTTADGRSLGIRELRQITDSGYAAPGDTKRFAIAKQKLDMLKLGASRPDEIISDPRLQKALEEYYLLQAGELDGTLSTVNYRGITIGSKKATKTRVLNSPPTEDNLKYNPLTGRYDDARMYQPSMDVLENTYRLVEESPKLKDIDKVFIKSFVDSLDQKLGANERAVITDNLRITFSRFRDSKEPWNNLKAVLQDQIKYDVMNVSDYIETQLRKDKDLLLRLKQENYLDPVLGPIQLQDLHDTFIDNIFAKNKWEDKVAPKIAKELRGILDLKIPPKLRIRLQDDDLDAFYLRFANRLSLADTPDRDHIAVSLGRDLYNLANYRGSRNEWWKLGVKLLDDAKDKGFYEIKTYGLQKRRMKSRLSGQYFGPYYDTFTVNLQITDPRIAKYALLTRKIDVGLRLGITDDKNLLKIREGYKTYFDRWNRDTRIPITSTSSFSDFPVELVDKDIADALNWTAQAKYKIDPDFHDFIDKLMYFQDDRGKAEYYNNLNLFRQFIAQRGDAYERFKAMKWLRDKDVAFSNLPYLDHRARIYDRGMISPQSGEVFRPFLNTAESVDFNPESFYNLQDLIGSFLGDISDKLEGQFNSLSILGRQGVAQKWRKDLIEIGYHMQRGKPNDIRFILESPFMALVDGEEQPKVLRFALEMSKIDAHIKANLPPRLRIDPYSELGLKTLHTYKTALALEQDASSSGAQIIALTTKNKQLAALSNVIPTNQKKRLYDEIAALTFNDPRFRKLNVRLGLTEKDLRKAAKAQNMVTFYGAGTRTGILNVEAKLAKELDKQTGTLVVKAADRNKVISEISARMARYEPYDQDMYLSLKALREDVKDIFNKGLAPGDDLLHELWFLDSKTRDIVEKLSLHYNKVVTPDDFALIASIMSENLASQTPILKDFTKFLGRLAEDYAVNAVPAKSALDIPAIIKTKVLGKREKEPLKVLERLPGWKPNGNLSDILYGVRQKELPKKWTNIPWVNFDGKIIEQNFTQTFEERLNYKDITGKWVHNIIQVDQKTDPTFWDELFNREGKMNAIVDASKARTAFAVNGNHSNDAVIVKKFHLWGKEVEIPTSTVHDAFFTNIVHMLQGRKALREIYAKASTANSIKATLDEMLKRGLPRYLYNQYLNEAIDIGLIPVPGRSRINGKLLTKDDILTTEDILKNIPDDFKHNLSWYGVG